MDTGPERTEKLIDEIKMLRAANQALSIQNNAHLIKIHGLESQLAEAHSRIDQLARDNASLLEEARLLTRRLKDRIKHVQIEMRRKDVFREVYRGSSKARKEELVGAEINQLRNINRVMLKFIQALEDKIGFDSNIAHELCTIADGIDDPTLQAFLDGIGNSAGCEL